MTGDQRPSIAEKLRIASAHGVYPLPPSEQPYMFAGHAVVVDSALLDNAADEIAALHYALDQIAALAPDSPRLVRYPNVDALLGCATDIAQQTLQLLRKWEPPITGGEQTQSAAGMVP